MNLFLGSYGGGGSVDMEVDDIRGYQWPLTGNNELPNSGFEANKSLLPWEGTATLSDNIKRSGKQALLLAPGQEIEQYVYLNNNEPYQLAYWENGHGQLYASIENVKLVAGDLEKVAEQTTGASASFAHKTLDFRTGKEYGDNMKTVRIHFRNMGNANVVIDDVTVEKRK